MEIFSTIWEYIGRTNLFNFVIFVAIFGIIFRSIKLGEKLEDSRQDIANCIEESDNAKNESVTNLEAIQNDIAHIEEDVAEIIRQSEENANSVGEKILEDANNQVAVIKDNSIKTIENKTVLLKNDIMKRASLASIEVAKKHIIDELSWNQGLHEKLIDESIEAIEGIEL